MNNKTLGRQLKEIRNAAGFTQNQAAEKLNVSKQYISAIETGNKTISFKRLNELCDLYNIIFEIIFLKP